MLPHLPFDAPPRFRRLYAGDPMPPFVRSYRANLTRFDATVGEVLDRLEELGLREHTLVLYVSDNGWDSASDAPFSAMGGPKGKGSVYELGVRTPLVLSWPGVLTAGARDDRLVSLVDVFATILDFAGAEPVPGASGRSLLPLLIGRGDFHRESVIGGGYDDRPRPRFLRTRTWRYVWHPGNQPEELYEIQEDPFETRNVADAHPEQIRRFREELARWVIRTEREAKEWAPKETPQR
jgi:arylsulfatase A-like enzyme